MKKYHVTVLPRSSRNDIFEQEDGSLKVKLTAAPVDGEANTALVAFLAKHFGVAKSRVKIVKGVRGKRKIVEIP